MSPAKNGRDIWWDFQKEKHRSDRAGGNIS